MTSLLSCRPSPFSSSSLNFKSPKLLTLNCNSSPNVVKIPNCWRCQTSTKMWLLFKKIYCTSSKFCKRKSNSVEHRRLTVCRSKQELKMPKWPWAGTYSSRPHREKSLDLQWQHQHQSLLPNPIKLIKNIHSPLAATNCRNANRISNYLIIFWWWRSQTQASFVRIKSDEAIKRREAKTMTWKKPFWIDRL